MRVGVSALPAAGGDIWSNGIGQNVFHLACLLRSIPFVEQVVLLDCGGEGQLPAHTEPVGGQFPLIPLVEADGAIDIAIELSGGLDAEWTRRFRARGGKVVTHLCGQPYAALVEPTIFSRPANYGLAERCDEVWLLPKDRQFFAMMRGVHRCPVEEVPYLWSPVFLDHAAEMVEQEGLSFGYRAGALAKGAVSAAIFEPNISTIKMGILPFLICDEVHRADPSALARLRFMNTAQFAKHHTFVMMVGRSSLYSAGKVSLEGRDYFARVMGGGVDIVVSHQIDCPQNYLYLDVLAGGYPLIHNSPLFADVGYYYPASDVDAGRAQFELACREHDRNLASYRARANEKIASLSPANSANRDAYARRLLAVTSRSAPRYAA